MISIVELPQLLEKALPRRTAAIRSIVEENTTSDGEVLYYPILSQVTSLVLGWQDGDDSAGGRELEALCALAEKALSDGDDRINALFSLEFVDAFSDGAYPGVPIASLLGEASLARFEKRQ